MRRAKYSRSSRTDKRTLLKTQKDLLKSLSIKNKQRSSKKVKKEIKQLEKRLRDVNKQLSNTVFNAEGLLGDFFSGLKSSYSVIEDIKHAPNFVEVNAIPQYAKDVFADKRIKMLDSINQLIQCVHSHVSDAEQSTKIIKFLISLGTTVYNIYHLNDMTSVCINMTNFLKDYLEAHHIQTVIDSFMKIFGMAYDGVVKYTAESDLRAGFQGIRALIDQSDDLTKDCRVTDIRQWVLKVVGLVTTAQAGLDFESFDWTQTWDRFVALRTLKDKSFDIIEEFLSAIDFVINNWQKIVTGDWSDLLLGRDMAEDFESSVMRLEAEYQYVQRNLVDDHQKQYGRNFSQFDMHVERTIKDGRSIMLKCSSAQQRMAVSRFIQKLMDIKTQRSLNGAEIQARAEPYCIKLFGGSATGKSTTMDMFNKVILQSYGFDPTQGGQVANVNAEEKFDNAEPFHKIHQYDDFGNSANGKPNYDKVLNSVNVVPRPFLKAEIKEKGVMYPDNVGCTISTNVEDLGAMKGSNCPESILRRIHVHITQTIAPEYRTAFGGIDSTKLSGMNYDIYEFELKRFSHIKESPIARALDENGEPMCDEDQREFIRAQELTRLADSDFQYTTDQADALADAAAFEFFAQEKEVYPQPVYKVIPRSEWMSNSSKNQLSNVVNWMKNDIIRHRAQQAKILKDREEVTNMTFCDVCSNPTPLCMCTKCAETEEMSAESMAALQSFTLGTVMSQINRYPTKLLWGFWSDLDYIQLMSWCTPVHLYNLFTLILNGKYGWYTQLAQLMTIFIGYLFVVACWSGISLMTFMILLIIAYTLIIISVMLFIRRMRQKILDAIMRKRDALSSIVPNVEYALHNYQQEIFGALCFASIFLVVYKTSKSIMETMAEDNTTFFEDRNVVFKSPSETQPTFKAKPLGDEKEYKEGYNRMNFNMGPKSKKTSNETLLNMVRKSLRYVMIKIDDQIYNTVNGIMVDSNLLMVPYHLLPDPETYPVFSIETSDAPGRATAQTKDQNLTQDYVIVNKDRDVALIHLPTSPPGKSFIDYFPVKDVDFNGKSARVIYKDSSSNLLEDRCPIRKAIDIDGSWQIRYGRPVIKNNWFGSKRAYPDILTTKKAYMTDLTTLNSFNGMCGAIYMDAVDAVLYGFHVCGNGGKVTGFTMISQEIIRPMIDELKSRRSIFVPHSRGNLAESVMCYGTGHTIEEGRPLMLDGENGIKSVATYHGKIMKNGEKELVRPRPPYHPSPYRNAVAEEFGPVAHRPPTEPASVEKALVSLDKLTNPNQHFEADTLARARDDYSKMACDFIKTLPQEDKDLINHIYSEQEGLDGIGMAGFGGMPNSTSAGFPINKSKSKILARDPLDESLPMIPRAFDTSNPLSMKVKERCDKVMDCWSRGERSECIFKSSSKVNELLGWEKAGKKVRKFYGGPMEYILPGRRVMGGFNALLARYPYQFECMVGMNCTSKQWGEFYTYMTEHGEDNCFAGDYSGFDTTMSAQVTSAAATVILDMYRTAGMSESDLMYVRGVLSELTHPNYNFEGDLLTLGNSNPSGQMITAQWNSIVNSLYVRYAFYKIYPNFTGNFKDVCNLACYGDDNACNVHKSYPKFNHTSVQEVFGRHGLGFTMADKESESVPYIHISEISFLKRVFVHHEELNCVVAPLEKESITKCFYWSKKTSECPLTIPEQFAAQVDGKLRDAALWGREYYNEFLSSITRVVESSVGRVDKFTGEDLSLNYHVNLIPYDDMIRMLKVYYQESYVGGDPYRLYSECTFVGLNSDDEYSSEGVLGEFAFN